jgi:SAM-dependent methyltransferase
VTLVSEGTTTVVATPVGPCVVCGEGAGWEPARIREMMFGSREAFDYGRCRACGSMVIAAVPDDLARHYPPAYYSLGDGDPASPEGAIRRRATAVLMDRALFGRRHRRVVTRLARRLAGEPPNPARARALVEAAHLDSFDDPILDVGSGARPVLLATLRRLGFRNVRAIEPFVDGDTTYLGVPVRKAVLSDVRGVFRLIMFHHSLEHVPEPRATLEAARTLLGPAGRIQVRTPVMGTGLWERYGPDWAELDAPRHLAVFSRPGFESMVTAAGFEIDGVTWESSDWEFVASEQYRRDIGMFEPGSHFVDPAAGGFGPEEIAGFQAEARRLNEAGQAGRASFWLRAGGR